MIQIFYGDGKGKTSALNGVALRAKGSNLKVGVFRFLKGIQSSEDNLLIHLGIPVFLCHPSNKFVFQMNENEKQEAMLKALEWIDFLKENISQYDVILLDEILDLISVGFINDEQLTNLIKQISVNKEVVITGHIKANSLWDKADLITYFKKEKHYFDKGIKARKGFEY